MNRLRNRQTILFVLVLIVVAAALFVPRSKGLGEYTFIDETYYLKHSAQFYWAVANQHYEDTYLIVHPGVTTMWMGAAAFWQYFPEYQARDSVEIKDLRFRMTLQNNQLTYLDMQVYARRVVVAFNTSLLIVAFVLCRRLFGVWPAVGAALLVGFDPFYFDYSRFLHVDGTMTTLMFVSLLAFLVYLREGHGWGWVLLSALMAGLAMLTKVIGGFMLLAVGFFALLEWWQPQGGAFGPRLSWRGFKKLVGVLLVWVLLMALVFFACWPAMWVAPLESLGKIVQFTLERSNAEVLSPMFFNGEINPTGTFGLDYAYYYPLTYLWRSSPVVWGGLLLMLVLAVVRPEAVKEKVPWGVVVRLGLFVLFYTAAMTLSKQKFDRYLLPAYLPLDVIAGIGWWYAADWLGQLFGARRRVLLPAAVVGAAVLLQGLLVYQVFPYGLSYYNPLMGGGEKAPQVMMVGAGEGLDQAADYMRTVPDKQELVIYSFYAGSFNFHYLENVLTLPWYAYNDFAPVYDADYVILYITQMQRGLAQPITDFLADKPVAYTVEINGIEYARIYHMSEFAGE